MKHLHDEDAKPDQNLQSQTALAARQQLGLDSQIALPLLPTPEQKSAGLHAAAPTPGLGCTPSLTQSTQHGSPPASTSAALALAAAPTPPAAFTPAATPAVTPAATPPTPSALVDTSASMSQQPTGRQNPMQSQSIKQRLQPHHDYVLQQQQQQQQRRAAEGSNSSLLEGDGSTKHWQGKLYVVNAKGEEFVCELATDAWPAHLSRYATLPVYCVKQRTLLPSTLAQLVVSHQLVRHGP